MDVFTHFLVPYASALVFFGLHRGRSAAPAPFDEERWRRQASMALVFGLAGFAPDLDGTFSWLKAQDGLYALQHRGVSHALVGAPVFALGAVFLMGIGARLFPRRLALFRFRPVFVPVAIAGSLTHILLDALTYGGIPLLWPFDYGRPTLDLYHWIVDWLFPIGLIATLLHIFRVVDRRGMAKVGAAVVMILVVLGGIQLAQRPDPEESGALLYTRHEIGEWTVLFPVEGGWVARIWTGGEYIGYMRFDEHIEPGSESAIAKARTTDAYKGFRMGSFGPVVVQTHGNGTSGWNVSFIDVAQRFETAMNPDWTPTTNNWRGTGKHAWGHLHLSVAADGKVGVVSLGW